MLKEQIPIFRLKPHNKTLSATIKYIGSIEEGEKVNNDIYDLVKNNDNIIDNTITYKTVDDYEITGNIYRCNIVGQHIVASSIYPLMYIDISYNKTFVSGSLFQIFFSINMSKEFKKNIKSNKEYVNLTFNGEWIQHFDGDDEIKSNFEKFVENDEEKQYCLNMFSQQKMEFISMDKVRDYFIEFTSTELFIKFVKIAIKCRNIQRRNKYGLTDESTYTKPVMITKLSDIQKNMLENDEIVFD